MKKYILPCLILASIVYLSWGQVEQSLEIQRDGRERVESAEKRIATLDSEKSRKTNALGQARKDSIRKEDMLKLWSGSSVENPLSLNRELDAIINKYGGLLSNSSNGPSKLNFRGEALDTHVYRTTIIGDFRSILQIVGEIEQTYPLSMISELTMAQSVAGISCQVSITIPRLGYASNNL